ncbi:MAG: hypothetical protein ACLFQV_05575 [Vulcanimicrobiota bacterium]
MKKETFLWMTLGMGIGMLVTSAYIYDAIMSERRSKEDPRVRRAEELIDEAENLLKAAKKSKKA